MFGLPKSTEFNRRIPKQKFYDNLDISTALKRIFVEQIKLIHWRNKLSPDTMNIAPGESVAELEVFELQLHQPKLDETALRQIDKGIPYHILFILTCKGKAQAWIGYKEAAQSGGNAFKVNRYYHTDWMPEGELILPLAGLTMDSIYENLVRNIAGDALQMNDDESLKDSVERDERRKTLEKEITALEGKIRREKQFNRQVELNTQLKKLRELEELD